MTTHKSPKARHDWPTPGPGDVLHELDHGRIAGCDDPYTPAEHKSPKARLDLPTPGTEGAARELDRGRSGGGDASTPTDSDLHTWIADHPRSVPTLELLCDSIQLESVANHPDAKSGETWLSFLDRWLRTIDRERGQVIGPPAFGTIEVECQAHLIPELLKFPIIQEVIQWSVDDPIARGAMGSQPPEELFPHRSAAYSLRTSRLMTDVARFSTQFDGSPFGNVVRAVHQLAQHGNDSEDLDQELEKWVNASVEIAEASKTPPHDNVLGPSATELARRLIAKAVSDLGASGYILCVRDPFLEDVYRVVLYQGVRYPEMLSGFSGFNAAAWFNSPTGKIPPGEEEAYCTSAADAFTRLPRHRWLDSLDGTPKARQFRRLIARKAKRIYAPYFVREQLKGLACLHGVQDGTPCLSLYLNFTTKPAFGNRVREYLRGLREELTRLYPRFREEFTTPVDFGPAARLLQTAVKLANLQLDHTESVLQNCLSEFLANCLEVLGVRLDEGFATLSKYEEEGCGLYPIASAGLIGPDPEPYRALYQSALNGEGVLSWVAIHRRAILIADITSPHIVGLSQAIDEAITPPSRSELAVPLMAGDELVGVLNFESIHPEAFTQSHLVLISFVANLIGIAWRECLRRRLDADLAKMNEVFRQANEVSMDQYIHPSDLISLDQIKACRDRDEFDRLLTSAWVRRTQEQRETLAQKWYECTREAFRANDGILWLVGDRKNRKPLSFSPAFASTPHAQLQDRRPRPDGWTAYVAQTKQIVCITVIRSPGEFRAMFWNGDQAKNWSISPGTDNNHVPSSLNVALIGDESLCLVGIPLINKRESFGVLWLKYHRNFPRQAFPNALFQSVLIRDAVLVPFLLPTDKFSTKIPRDFIAGMYTAVVEPQRMAALRARVSETSVIALDGYLLRT